MIIRKSSLSNLLLLILIKFSLSSLSDQNSDLLKCACVDPSECLAPVTKNAERCNSNEICCPSDQVSGLGLITVLGKSDGIPEDCSCLQESDCSIHGGIVSAITNPCQEPYICCNLNITNDDLIRRIIGDNTPEPLISGTCRCVGVDNCAKDISSIVHVRTSIVHVCQPEEICCDLVDIIEPHIPLEPEVNPVPVLEKCQCVSTQHCAKDISSIVHVRTNAAPVCPPNEICCDRVDIIQSPVPVSDPVEDIPLPVLEPCQCVSTENCAKDISSIVHVRTSAPVCGPDEICCNPVDITNAETPVLPDHVVNPRVPVQVTTTCQCISKGHCAKDISSIVHVRTQTIPICGQEEICCDPVDIIHEPVAVEVIEKCECVNENLCAQDLSSIVHVRTATSVCGAGEVCCNKVDILDPVIITVEEPIIDPITNTDGGQVEDTCACVDAIECAEKIDLSAKVQLRTGTCSDTQVCCPFGKLINETSVASTDPTTVACTCVPNEFCTAGPEEILSQSQLEGFQCLTDSVCCPNFKIHTPEDCTCTEPVLCENQSLSVVGNGKRCVEPQICCVKPKVFNSPPKCGLSFNSNYRINVRIQLGFQAQFAEFPWMVAIYEWNADGSEKYLCGGSLIHPSVVLTVAHCVDKKVGTILKIRAGDWDLESTSENRPYVERLVSVRKIHNRWSPKSLRNNVALLYLDSEVPLQQHINTICLPKDNHFEFDPACTASGWGKNKFEDETVHQRILKKVNLPFIPNPECQEYLRKTRLGPKFILDKSYVCAGGTREDTCTGDGGSPLICPMIDGSSRFAQVGIVSWGLECGKPDIPGAYSSTMQASEWIIDCVTKDFGKEAVAYFT